MSDEKDPLVGISTAARLVGKPVSTFWRWVNDGLIASERVRPTNLRKIRLSSLNGFLKGTALEKRKITKDEVEADGDKPMAWESPRSEEPVDVHSDGSSGDRADGDDHD